MEPDIQGKDYQRLIEVLARHCNRFAFVLEILYEIEEEELERMESFISDIKWHLIERKKQKEWEARSVCGGGVAYVYYFHLNNETREFLKTRSNSIYGWIPPELPEDLMFYKDNECKFAAISHEREYYVDENIWETFVSS